MIKHFSVLISLLLLFSACLFMSGCEFTRLGTDYLLITADPNPVSGTLLADLRTREWVWAVTFKNKGILDIIVSSATLTITTDAGSTSQEIFVGPFSVPKGEELTTDFGFASVDFTQASLVYVFKGVYAGGPEFTSTLGITLN